jgi:hypothetical protein
MRLKQGADGISSLTLVIASKELPMFAPQRSRPRD